MDVDGVWLDINPGISTAVHRHGIPSGVLFFLRGGQGKAERGDLEDRAGFGAWEGWRCAFPRENRLDFLFLHVSQLQE